MAVYDNKTSADAGQENMKNIMTGMAEFVTGDYNVREGEEILRLSLIHISEPTRPY